MGDIAIQPSGGITHNLPKSAASHFLGMAVSDYYWNISDYLKKARKTGQITG